MSTMRSTTIRAYRESEILTASRERLLVITFDALVASLTRAKLGATMQSHDVTINGIDRARALLGELIATLDHEAGGELSGKLASIYVFLLGELDRMALRPDAKTLERHLHMVTELRDAFAQVALVPKAGVA
jgi:flagellar protein FliS